MGSFGCILWWCLLGGLLGWLASWMFGRRKPVVVERIVDRPVDRIVEKIVDRPVDKIVEKIVEKPVDRVIEKLVDNPAHMSRISSLEGEVALIAGLRSTISRLEATPPKIVEKIIDRPVDRIVEKIVDRPVDRIVEKMFDNPAHLARVKTLELEVALIAGLRSTISRLEATPAKIVEKIVDRPVDRIVEKVVEKIVDRPVEKIVEKIVDRPVDRIVEKIVEKIVDRPVDRIVEKLVDNPAHLSRIKTLETEVATIAGFRQTITRLESTPPKIVEKIVERPVDRVVERIVDRPVEKIVERIVDRPVEKIVEKIVDRPVDRIVEKVVEKIVDRPVDRIVEKLIDNPAHLGRIKNLEAEVATIAGFRQTIARLESTPPKIVEKIIDRPVDRIVEKIVDRPVDRIVERIVDRPVDRIVEKIVDRMVDRPVDRIVEKIVDRPVDRVVEKVVEKLVDNPEQQKRIRVLEAELEGFRSRSVVLDKVSSKAAGFTVRGMDDLEVIEGIGPKIAGLLHDAGIHMFWELAETPTARMQTILDAAGPNYKLANPSTWAMQSGLAAENRWAELRKTQDELNAGVKK